MEDSLRDELHNVIADIQVKHKCTFEEACLCGIRVLKKDYALRQISKNAFSRTNDYILNSDSDDSERGKK